VGQGQPFMKGYNNDTTHNYCYSFATYNSNKSVLKSFERVDALSLSQLMQLYQIKFNIKYSNTYSFRYASCPRNLTASSFCIRRRSV